MDRDTDRQPADKPDADEPERAKADTPFCDEFSGGGGSATDTRDRGQPGGTRKEGDCTPIGRGDV